MILSNFNHPRFKENDSKGHYESWFVRANHPNTCKAIWIRYTIFSPKNFPEKAMGELWAIYFDGEKKLGSFLSLNSQSINVNLILLLYL
ncbi:hypothetical protein LEP1GSC109_1391 [Leptospira interrogans str. UI 13372]|nr:hypothetical protein LEP1GSC109_1391 [Leptospira interrogans str. UI 13372]